MKTFLVLQHKGGDFSILHEKITHSLSLAVCHIESILLFLCKNDIETVVAALLRVNSNWEAWFNSASSQLSRYLSQLYNTKEFKNCRIWISKIVAEVSRREKTISTEHKLKTLYCNYTLQSWWLLRTED